MNKLNPRQHEAVRYADGPLLVLAGAGSGKTSVITRKIAYLIEELGIPGRHIAAVTFTNKAAREMKERVGRIVDRGKTRGLIVSTFHNLGLNMIREEHTHLGYHPGFSIFDAEDAKALLQDLMMREASAEAGDELNDVQMTISSWKNAMRSPAEAYSKAADEREQRIAIVYKHYNEYLKAYNAVDFDDLILLPVQLFRDNPEVLAKWRRKIRYMLVDEYQDTNVCQYELVKQLVAERAAFTVVGDDDQSIYAWRGARPENLAQLKDDFPSLKIVKLEQNYRSTSRILRCANTVIANNPHVFEKALWSDHTIGEEIRIIRCRNEDAETERVATEILDQKLKNGLDFRDFAVLYRGNHQARLLEMKLQAYQIPYRISGGQSFFSKNEIKDAMSYLRLMINPDDDAAFLSVGVAALLGIPVGLIAGYAGGYVDEAVSRIIDTFLSFPAIVLAIAVTGVLGIGLTNAMIAVGIVFAPQLARLARARALVLKQELYVDAARCFGASTGHILIRHVLPNAIQPVLVQMTLLMAVALLAEASLSFLGLGMQPPEPSWGSMIARAYLYIQLAPEQMWAPGIAILVTALSFNTLGEGLREALDPTSR